MTDGTHEDEASTEEDGRLDPLVMCVTENFKHGDPASPEDITIEVFHKSHGMEVVARVQIMADANSEDFYEALLDMARQNGMDVVGTSNVNNHYYT